MAVFSPHPLVLQTAFSELKRRAMEQRFVLIGSPGSVSLREVGDRSFFYRQYYDAEGKKSAQYLGAADAPEAQARAQSVREEIVVANGLVTEARLLARSGYVRVDSRTSAVVASFANHGLFRAGAVLVGSHAYGALLNNLGVKSAAFVTEDVDLARDEPMKVDLGSDTDFESILAESTVPLRPVPGLDRKTPSTSYKAPGADRFRVDLLVPGRGDEVAIRPVSELKAHATALPHLRYLLADPIDAIVIGREAVVPARVPRPEAFAWHKMLVSQLRNATSDKRPKDLHQAAVLFAVLAEEAPDALEAAFAALPRGCKTRTRIAAKTVLAQLNSNGHGRAAELLGGLVYV